MLKVAVVGLGKMGSLHARAWTEIPEVQLVGIIDRDNDLAKNLASRFKIKVYKSIKQLAEAGVEAVSICTPTTTHCQLGLEALDLGLHTLIEKPIASTVEDGKKLIAKAEKTKLKLMIGHIERFNPAVMTLKKEIEGKEDEIISINITRVGPLPPRINDVGIIVDLSVHDIDLIAYLAKSDFAKIYSLSSASRNKKEDTAILSFKMANNILASINTNWLTPYKLRIISIATKKRLLEANLITQSVTEYSHYQRDSSRYFVKSVVVPFGEPLYLELQAFARAIVENQPVSVSAKEGLKVLEVAIKCAQSVQK